MSLLSLSHSSLFSYQQVKIIKEKEKEAGDETETTEINKGKKFYFGSLCKDLHLYFHPILLLFRSRSECPLGQTEPFALIAPYMSTVPENEAMMGGRMESANVCSLHASTWGEGTGSRQSQLSTPAGELLRGVSVPLGSHRRPL